MVEPFFIQDTSYKYSQIVRYYLSFVNTLLLLINMIALPSELDYTEGMSSVRYRKDTDLPWRRVKSGSGFRYVTEKGTPIPESEKERIAGLVIPPAWHDVVISDDARDYIQAIGVDDRGRKQYIYHPEWVKQSQSHKFDQMIAFGERLPTLRRAVNTHMKERGLTKDRVVATVIWLLENTFIRVGNKAYAEENQSYGLTTMREKHVDVSGNTVTFSFPGKSGVYHELGVTNPRVAKNVKACLELPGYELFQYFDQERNRQVVDSADVNSYLKEHTGADFSAKDFRTWGGSVIAGDAFYKKGSAVDKDDLKTKTLEVVTLVSKNLGNTKAVCREYYIHPTIIRSYEKDILVPYFQRSYGRQQKKRLSLHMEEYATWSLIKNA
jgi:DNA topoisomerase I